MRYSSIKSASSSRPYIWLDYFSRYLVPATVLATAACLLLCSIACHADGPSGVTGTSLKIRAALYKGPGTYGNGPPDLMKELNSTNARTSLVEITPVEIRAGSLTNFDVVIFAGGSGSKQGEALGTEGREQVRAFVRNGGGYIGICGGAFLGISGYPWSLHLINAKTLSPKWQRGKAVVKMELTPKGEEIIGKEKILDVLYHQGPIVGPANATNLPSYDTLAYFRTEISSNDTPAGIMINSPAIFAGKFTAGKVVCISPHPEQTAGLEYIVPQAVMWVAPASSKKP